MGQWDLVIRPKRHLLDINLKEIWTYRDLVMLFVRRDYVSRYKQTILGPFWFILNPLISTLMYTLTGRNRILWTQSEVKIKVKVEKPSASISASTSKDFI